MNAPQPDNAVTRRQFVGGVVPSALALTGLAAVCLRPLARADEAAPKNPFSYDVSRYAKTDPALIGWEEVSRQQCPIRETRRLAAGPGGVIAVAAGRKLAFCRGTAWETTADLGGDVGCAAALPDGGWLAGLRDRVLVLDAKGVRRKEWQPAAKNAWLTGIAATEEGAWVADSGQRIILCFDRDGRVVGRLGAKSAESGAPGFVLPSPFLDVHRHPDGLLRVNNPGRHRVEAYTTEGHFELAWGKPTAAIEGFCGCCNPIALALLPDGRIVTGEKGLPRVKVYAADGAFEAVVAGTELFAENARRGADASDRARQGLDVAVDSLGRIAVLDRITAEVRFFKPKAAKTH